MIENIEFNVGGMNNADEKIRTIVSVLENMPSLGLVPGFFDLREISNEYFFERLE
jgi:hypothetical protein